MIIRTLNLYRFYLRIASGLLPTAAFLLAGVERFSHFGGFAMRDYAPIAYFQLLIAATVVWMIAAEHYGLTDPETLARENTGMKPALASCTVTYVVLFAILFFYRETSFSRVFFALSSVLLLAMALALRGVFRGVLRRGVLRRGGAIRVLVIGADRFAHRAAVRLMRSAVPPCVVIGFVNPPGRNGHDPANNIYAWDQMQSAGPVDEVVVALAPERWAEVPRMLPQLERLGVPVRAIIDLGRGVVIREKFFQVGQLNILDLGSGRGDTLNYLLLKRVFDVTFAAAVLILGSPLFLLIALAVKLTSRGPICFVQERIGLNGRSFRMYKFRTMRIGTVEECDTRWTTAGDARCTALGRFLRASSLDEMPQFFNVLKGDMSVVGPRPERPHFVRKFLQDIARYNTRHCLKVGITGWAQVNGLRGDTSIRRRITYDRYYIQNWTFGLDLRIIFRTVWGGFFGRNAY